MYYTIISHTKMSSKQFQFANGSLDNMCHKSSPPSPLDNHNKNTHFESEEIEMMKKDIESIGRWYNIRRDKILQDLIKLHEDYQQMVQEHTNKWTEQIEQLYATEGFEQEQPPIWQKKCRVMRAMSDGELIPTDIGLFNQKQASDETANTIFTPSKGFHLSSLNVYDNPLTINSNASY